MKMCRSLSASSAQSPGHRSLLWRPCVAAVLRCCCSRYPGTLPGLGVSGQNVQTGQDLLRRLSQHALNVTDEAVDVAFARCLVDDVLVVVVTQATAQLLVVHLGFVLALAPALGHLLDQQAPHRDEVNCVYTSVKHWTHPLCSNGGGSKPCMFWCVNDFTLLNVLESAQ